MLGRIGTNKSTLRIADFRHQRGIYILYDDYGPAYVGLTRKRGLGLRLRDHLDDRLDGKWDRFSWFGFWDTDNATGRVEQLMEAEAELTEETDTTIGDVEALLIRAIGPKLNRAKMSFSQAQEWTQIEFDEIDTYLDRIS